MQIEILHSVHGDKKKDIDTTNPEGRGEAHELIKLLANQKCALFLERKKGKKTETYRVTGYDPATDKLIVEVTRKGKKTLEQVTTKGFAARCAAVAPVAGG